MFQSEMGLDELQSFPSMSGGVSIILIYHSHSVWSSEEFFSHTHTHLASFPLCSLCWWLVCYTSRLCYLLIEQIMMFIVQSNILISKYLFWLLNVFVVLCTGKVPPNLPPGVPPLLPNPYIMAPGLLHAYPVGSCQGSVWPFCSPFSRFHVMHPIR